MHLLTTTTILLVSLIAVHCFRVPNVHSPTKEEANREVIQYGLYDIAGFGYSNDLQQMTTQRCFEAKVGFIGKGQQVLKLSVAQTSESLEQSLGVSVSAEGSYMMFSASAEAEYMRSLQETSNSLSLNYYQYTSSEVTVELDDDILTTFGKRIYGNGSNPLFGVTCGDKYVSSYQQGALLIMGLNIKLGSEKDKKEFTAKAGFKFGNIISASTTVKTTGESTKVSGSVEIHAYQIGGEPSQLGKIFKKDTEGQYYAFSCNIQEMDKCLQVASGLLDYASEEMPKQFSVQENKGLTPLGLATTSFQPVGRVGLIPSPTLVTAEVEQYRKDLARKLKENQFYEQKLYSFIGKGYPVALAPDFIQKAKTVYDKAARNVRRIMQPHGGAADCFNYPEECKAVKTKIESELQTITADDLKILSPLKFYVSIPQFGDAYNTGGGQEWSWAVPNVADDSVSYIRITEEKCSYKVKRNQYGTDIFDGAVRPRMPLEPIFPDERPQYIGKMTIMDVDTVYHVVEQAVVDAHPSPFYFKALSG